MKTLSRILRIALASTLALSQGAWFPALASSGKHQAVVAIGMDELKSEYGAGGGGGGSDPVVDPGTGGGSCSTFNATCQLVMTSVDRVNLVTTQTEDDVYDAQLHNSSAITAFTISTTYTDNCRLALSDSVGIAVPWSIGIGVEKSCATAQTVSRYLQPLQRANIFRDAFYSTWTEYQYYAFQRNGVNAGYAGMRTSYYRKTERKYALGATF